MKKIFSKTFITATAISATLFVAFVFISFAADGIKYNVLAPFPANDTTEAATEAANSVSTFSGYLKGAIPFILRLAAVFAVVQIVIGGFQYALSEAIGQKEDSKDRMTQAILGLVLAMTSYLILVSINPDLVKLKIGIRPISEVVQIPNASSSDDNSSKNQNNWQFETKTQTGTWTLMSGIANNGSLSETDCNTLSSSYNDTNTYRCVRRSNVTSQDNVICHTTNNDICFVNIRADRCQQINGEIHNPSNGAQCPTSFGCSEYRDVATNAPTNSTNCTFARWEYCGLLGCTYYKTQSECDKVKGSTCTLVPAVPMK